MLTCSYCHSAPLNRVGEDLSDSALSDGVMSEDSEWRREINSPPSQIGLLVQALLLMRPGTHFVLRREEMEIVIEKV